MAVPIILVDTPTDTMRFMLDLPPMQTRQEAEKVKAYFSAVEIPETTPCSRERYKGVQSGTGQTLEESILQVYVS